MDFLWLRDRGLSVLFENDEIIAVDKPYGLDTHTNEAKDGQADFIQPGLIELFEKQRGPLHVVHRLDRTTSGVIVFAKTLEAAKKYQGFFRARETKKTYLFITASDLKTANRSHTGASLTCDAPIIRNGSALEASTDFKRLAVTDDFALWVATPHAGRNHQIRIHAGTLGLPLLGDEKYGGEKFPFICLHNRRIEFPNGVVIESNPPVWFENLELLKDERYIKALFEIDRRNRLFANSARCLRWVHPKTNGLDYALDLFDSHVVLSWYGERWSETDEKMFERLAESVGRKLLVKFMAPKLKASAESVPLATRWTVLEGEIKHQLRMDSGQAPGLFLDQRLQREWVRENSKGKTVLNLFSYTGGFSVAAVMGGATAVASVDSNKSMLNWARENFALNGLDADAHTFLCRDVVTFLDQAVSKAVKFDIVVCDAPSFSRSEKGLFKIEVELENLIKKSVELLAPGGELLFSLNAESIFVDDVRRTVLKIKKDLKLSKLEISSVQPSLDFELPGEAPGLKSFLISSISF